MTKRPCPPTVTLSIVETTNSSKTSLISLRNRSPFTVASSLYWDISEGLVFEYAPIKKLILGEIHQGVKNLKTSHMLDVPNNIVLKEASTVAGRLRRP